MEDVRGFEVESFILDCAPKALGQQHLFSCLAVVVCRVFFCGVHCASLSVCFFPICKRF